MGVFGNDAGAQKYCHYGCVSDRMASTECWRCMTQRLEEDGLFGTDLICSMRLRAGQQGSMDCRHRQHGWLVLCESVRDVMCEISAKEGSIRSRQGSSLVVLMGIRV
jgi:hypothetical protein